MDTHTHTCIYMPTLNYMLFTACLLTWNEPCLCIHIPPLGSQELSQEGGRIIQPSAFECNCICYVLCMCVLVCVYVDLGMTVEESLVILFSE